MPPVFGAGVTLADALVVLRRCRAADQSPRRSVEHEQARLLAGKERLDHRLTACGCSEDVGDRRLRVGARHPPPSRPCRRPARRPSRRPARRTRSSAASASSSARLSTRRKGRSRDRRVRAQTSLVKPFEPFEPCRRRRVGPEHREAGGAKIVSASPVHQRRLRTDDHQAGWHAGAQNVDHGTHGRSTSIAGPARHGSAMPGLPGAAQQLNLGPLSALGDCASFHASACSRPPASQQQDVQWPTPSFPKRAGAAGSRGPVPGDNSALAVSVGELAGKLKRLVEGEFGHVRLRGEISGFKRVGLGPHRTCASRTMPR